MPGRKVGGEWRFELQEVMEWTRPSCSAQATSDALAEDHPHPRPPLLAGNGDLALQLLLSSALRQGAPFLGLVEADGGTGLEMLLRYEVLAAGYHGPEPIPSVPDRSLAVIHLVEREIGFVARDPLRIPWLEDLFLLRFASRPVTAGVRRHLDRALLNVGIDPLEAHARARLFDSHRDVVLAVACGEVEAGIATRSWARRLGLAFRRLTVEDYCLVVPSDGLADPAVERLVGVAESTGYRSRVERLGGYDSSRAGTVRLQVAPSLS